MHTGRVCIRAKRGHSALSPRRSLDCLSACLFVDCLADLAVDADAAPVLAAHGAVVRRARLRRPLGDLHRHFRLAGFAVHPVGRLRVERRAQVRLPVQIGPGHAQLAVAGVGPLETAGDVRRVGRDLGGHDAGPDVVGVGQAEMLARRHVAQERRPVERGGAAPDGGGDVVVAGGDVRHQGAQHVEGGPVADLLLHLHVALDLMEGDVAGTFDHDLAAPLLGPLGQLAQCP